MFDKKIKKPYMTLALTAVFLITSMFAANAETLSQQLSKAQNERKAAEQQLSSIQSQKKNAQAVKTQLDSEISSLNADISSLQNQISQTDGQITTKQQELDQAEAACEEQFSSFKTRARIMYENGPSTYIEMLFASGSFSEFASNVEIIKNLLDYDEKVLEERKQVREVIAQQKAELDAVRAEQETRRQTLSEKQASLTTKQQTQAAVISQLAQQEQMILNQTKEQMAKEKQLQQRINQSRAVSSVSTQTYKSSPSVTTAKAVFSGSASGSEAVRIAKSYIGVPYVYGGTTPNGFDCSGFVQYVYRQMGISINRVAADQAKNGTYVAKEDLQPGDLVFFAKPGRTIHHVGMYVGNGQYIHAPYTGRTIAIENLTRRDYYTARRIVS